MAPIVRKVVAVIIGLGGASTIACVFAEPMFGTSRRTDQGREKFYPNTYSQSVGEYGWPFTYRIHSSVMRKSGDQWLTEEYWHWPSLYADVFICVLLLVGSGLGLAILVCAARWPPQFSLMALLHWTLIASVVFALAHIYSQFDTDDEDYFPPFAIAALLLTLIASGPALGFIARGLLCLAKSSAGRPQIGDNRGQGECQ